MKASRSFKSFSFWLSGMASRTSAGGSYRISRCCSYPRPDGGERTRASCAEAPIDEHQPFDLRGRPNDGSVINYPFDSFVARLDVQLVDGKASLNLSAAAPAEIGALVCAGAVLGSICMDARKEGSRAMSDKRCEPSRPKAKLANRRDRAPISSGENVDTFPSTRTLTIANERSAHRRQAPWNAAASALSSSRSLKVPGELQTRAKKRRMKRRNLSSDSAPAREERPCAPSISSTLNPTSRIPLAT